MVRALRAVDKALAKVEEVALAACMLMLILVGCYQAVKRNLFPPAAFWTDELIRYSVFFIGLIGGALATQSNRLINIDVLTRLLRPRGKLVIRIVTALFTAGVCYLFIEGGLAMRPAIREKGELMKPVTALLSLPIGAGLIGVHMLLHVVLDSIDLVKGRIPPELESGERHPA